MKGRFFMKQTIAMILVTLSMICIFQQTGDDTPIIPKEAIRFRVLANSNSEEDQKIKEYVRDDLQKELYETLKDTTSIQEAKEIILKNLDTYDTIVKNTLKAHNYQMPYTIDYGNHYFPQKVYKGIPYQAGSYESLLVTLGNGEGNNWWCVLFPPLCLLEAEETTTSEVQYKFFVSEILDRFF